MSAADSIAPTATNFSPADETTGVAVGSNIVVTFSEAIDRGTGNIVLKTAAGATVATELRLCRLLAPSQTEKSIDFIV